MDEWQAALQQVLDYFIRTDREAIFHLPVDTRDVDDYLQVVALPMDFSTIQANLTSGGYPHGDRHLFYRHLELTFNNAILFNRPRSVYATEARRMRGLLPAVFREFLTTAQRIELASQACEHLRRIPVRTAPQSGITAASPSLQPAPARFPDGALPFPGLGSFSGSLDPSIQSFQSHLEIVVQWALLTYETQRQPGTCASRPPLTPAPSPPRSFYDVQARLEAGGYHPTTSSPLSLSASLRSLRQDLLAALQALAPTKGFRSSERRAHATLIRNCGGMVAGALALVGEHWGLPGHCFSESTSTAEDGASSELDLAFPLSDRYLEAPVPQPEGHGQAGAAPHHTIFTFAERMECILAKQSLLAQHSHHLGEVYIGKGIRRGDRLYEGLIQDPECQRQRAQLLLLEEQIYKLEGKYLSELAGDPSLLNGWRGYVELAQTLGSAATVPGQKRVRDEEEERQFSNSSVNSAAAMHAIQTAHLFAPPQWMPPALYREYLIHQKELEQQSQRIALSPALDAALTSPPPQADHDSPFPDGLDHPADLELDYSAPEGIGDDEAGEACSAAGYLSEDCAPPDGKRRKRPAFKGWSSKKRLKRPRLTLSPGDLAGISDDDFRLEGLH